ncbi:MAG: hypothetical protein ABI851_09445 [Saprospiraceae bacterium]
MRKGILLLLSFLFLSSIAFTQGNISTLFEKDRWNISKNEIHGGHLFQNHSSIHPYLQHRILNEFENPTVSGNENIVRNNYEYFHYQNDSIVSKINEANKNRKFLHFFNTYPGHFYSIYRPDFYISIDPLLDISGGFDLVNKKKVLNNSRGIRLKIGIDNKVFLFSEILETQTKPIEYIDDYANNYKAFPGAGFVKSYSSKIFNINNGYDYLLANGGIMFRATKHIDVTFAHSENFIGQGIRSLLISNAGAPCFYLKLNSQFGRFNYQNIFSELSSENRFINDVDKLLQKKYLAAHYLSLNIGKNWNIGLFESVVFNRKKGFELQYLNPIIFYRAIEQAVGSPDNVLIGFQSHINLMHRFSIYGQFILDEFVLNRVITNNEGWWANKYGFQFGLKYPDFLGIKSLNIQSEFNVVRPYTYSYSDSIANYSHYHQSLAHPLGSNFEELIGRINYSIGHKAFVQLQFMLYSKGLDSTNSNFGGNILKSNTTRVMDYNNKILQGLDTRVSQAVVQVSYELFSRTWLDLNLGLRQSSNSILKQKYKWIEVGLRINLDHRNYEF